jgi:hypothetical protein
LSEQKASRNQYPRKQPAVRSGIATRHKVRGCGTNVTRRAASLQSMMKSAWPGQFSSWSGIAVRRTALRWPMSRPSTSWAQKLLRSNFLSDSAQGDLEAAQQCRVTETSQHVVVALSA